MVAADKLAALQEGNKMLLWDLGQATDCSGWAYQPPLWLWGALVKLALALKRRTARKKPRQAEVDYHNLHNS